MAAAENAMSGPLGREQILELFEELSEELRFSRARAQIYVVGGAAMSLAFDRERTTRDVDARVAAGHHRLAEAVRAVGLRHGLPDTWLNEQATAWMPRAEDARAQTVYESPYLTVTGASAKHLLAMKLRAGREQDREDIAVLCKHLGLRRREEAIRIYKQVFPGEHVKFRALALLERTFQDRSVGYER